LPDGEAVLNLSKSLRRPKANRSRSIVYTKQKLCYLVLVAGNPGAVACGVAEGEMKEKTKARNAFRALPHTTRDAS
jgi:hypothetical protein